MLAWLFKFCRGQTDVNENKIPDNEEVMRALEILLKKLEDSKLKR
jgi:hypothetical protein